MYPLVYLTSEEISRVEQEIDKSLINWLSKCSFTSDVNIELNSVRYEQIPVDLSDYFKKSSSTGCLIFDEQFKWDQFIFSDQLPICPRNSSFSKLIEDIKKNFYLSVLGVDQASESPYFSKTMDAYLNLNFAHPAIGKLSVYAPHSYFASFITKESTKILNHSLSTRRDAIQSLKVPLTMSLDFGNIPFGELLDLKPGKIVKSTIAVENQFVLALCDAPVAKISIGKVDNKMAFIVKSRKT